MKCDFKLKAMHRNQYRLSTNEWIVESFILLILTLTIYCFIEKHLKFIIKAFSSTRCWLVMFYGISIHVGYLIPNIIYIYIYIILNKSWRQHPTRHQLYGHLPPITKTIQVRRTRHAGHCWRSRDELISDVLLWTPTHGRAKAGRPARTYIQQLWEDTGCCPEDLPEAMNDREKWQERVRDIHATSTTWWWWWWYIY